MPTPTRNSQGKYQATHNVTPAYVYECMKPLEPYTTSELAHELNVPRRTLLNYLNELADNDYIRKKQPEPKRIIWIRPD